MAKLDLNKSELHKQREQLKLYKKVLPSLDLKRQQLTAEWHKSRKALQKAKDDLEALYSKTAAQIPMLALDNIQLHNLVSIEAVRIEEENVAGVRLPKLMDVQTSIKDYSMLAQPHWIDKVADRLEEAVRLTLLINVAEDREKELKRMVRRVTQRVNLFEKVLIPQTEYNIKRIQIYMGEAERAAVVRSKLAKSMLIKKNR